MTDKKTDQQAEIIAFLQSPAAHHDSVKQVERIDTHISAVFLAGQRVYKMKRSVTLPFLDFSTLEKRKAACFAEVAVNRRTAPDLYRGLASVNRDDHGRLSLGGAGEVVEWLVAMNRFDQKTLFDRMAREGKLTRDIVAQLGQTIASFHKRAEIKSDYGGRAGLGWTIDTNVRSFANFIPQVFQADAIEHLTRLSQEHLDHLTPLLEQRRLEGKVRACHGDLHLGNICLFEGNPCLFDAIEFSEAIASVDVLYDLAFLLMDLDRVGHRRLACFLMNHYFDLTGDSGGLEALPLFLSARAAIRAHVSAAIAANLPPKKAAAKVAEARSYFDQALAYLQPQAPRLVAVGGFSGSGKSRMGRELATFLGRAPGALVVRSDVMRKHLAGIDIHSKLDDDYYSAEMTERTYQVVYDTAERALRAGHSVVADAVFARPDQRAAIAALAARLNVPFQGLWLEAPEGLMRHRIRTRKNNASDATEAVLDMQLGFDLGPMEWTKIDSSGPKNLTVEAGREAVGV